MKRGKLTEATQEAIEQWIHLKPQGKDKGGKDE